METIHYKTVQDYNDLKGVETVHPLISIINFKSLEPKFIDAKNYKTDVYLIVLKETNCAEIIYGRNTYDYQEGTLVFFEPGQEFGLEYRGVGPVTASGWGLIFDKELLEGSHLKQKIKDFHFFSYAISESLHISNKERSLVIDLFEKFNEELNHPIDKTSRELLLNYLEMLLNYSKRFYDRQFNTREHTLTNLSEKLNNLLIEYYFDQKHLRFGPPNVSYCAEAFNLSANYFGDLVKQQLGISAQGYIQDFLLDKAKTLFHTEKDSIKEVSYALGFEYPNHFSRFFKEKTGMTPSVWKDLN